MTVLKYSLQIQIPWSQVLCFATIILDTIDVLYANIKRDINNWIVRDANLSPLSENWHFESKIDHLHDLCRSKEFLKVCVVSSQNIDWLSTIMHAPYNPFTIGIVTTIFTQLQESVCKTSASHFLLWLRLVSLCKCRLID